MKNSLSPAQYAIVAIVLFSVFKLSALPSLTASYAGRDIWMSVSVMLLTEIISLAFIVPVSVAGGLVKIGKRYGKIVYTLISAPVIAVLIIKILVYVSEVNAFSSSYLFYNISTDKVGIVFVIVAAYIASKGFKGIGRAASLALWTLPLILAIGLVFGEIDMDFQRLKPVTVSGAAPVLGAAWKYAFWGFDFTPLLFCELKNKENKSLSGLRSEGVYAPYTVFGAVSVAAAIIAFVYVMFTAVYGNAAFLSPHAFASLGSFNVVNTEIGSIDWPAIVCWLAFAVIAVSFYLGAAGEWVREYGVKPIFGITGAVAVLCATGPFCFNNLERAVDFATGVVRYFVPGVSALVPLAAFVLTKLAERAAAKQNGGNADAKML